MNPRQPALATPATISARPTHIMPPCTTGMRTPRCVLSHVLKGIVVVRSDSWAGTYRSSLLLLPSSRWGPCTLRKLIQTATKRWNIGTYLRYPVGRESKSKEGGVSDWSNSNRGKRISISSRPRHARNYSSSSSQCQSSMTINYINTSRRLCCVAKFCCVTDFDHNFPNLSTSPHVLDGLFRLLKVEDFVYHIVKAQLCCLYSSYQIFEVVFRSNVDASETMLAWRSLITRRGTHLKLIFLSISNGTKSANSLGSCLPR